MNVRHRNRLGGTAVPVTAAGLGCASLAGIYRASDEEDAAATVAAAVEAGIGYFDVAPRYGMGVAETRLGSALRSVPRDRFTLSTKVGWQIVDGARVADFTRDGVLRSLDASLARMKLDRIDVAFVHDPDDHEAEARSDVFPALISLREQGVLGAIGAGMNYWEPLHRFAGELPIDCVLLASRYTLLDRSGLPLMDLCARKGVSVVAGGVFNTGILATGSAGDGRYDYRVPPPAVVERVRALERVCRSHGVPLAAAALQFPLRHPAAASVLIGAGTPARLAANLDDLARAIPDAFWEEVEALRPAAPDRVT